MIVYFIFLLPLRGHSITRHRRLSWISIYASVDVSVSLMPRISNLSTHAAYCKCDVYAMFNDGMTEANMWKERIGIHFISPLFLISSFYLLFIQIRAAGRLFPSTYIWNMHALRMYVLTCDCYCYCYCMMIMNSLWCLLVFGGVDICSDKIEHF